MKVFITRPIPENGVRMLKAQGYDMVADATEADAILSGLDFKIDQAFLDAASSNLKIVANYAVGYDNIDLAAAKAHRVIVTNTPDVLTEAVAEHTIGLMLSVTRRISESDRYIRAGKWHEAWTWDFMLGMELSGKTLGIIGPGRIGSRVGELAKALGMSVEMCGPKEKLEDCLPRYDVVSLHVPLMESTRHLINEARLKLMKPTAYLINTSRGPVVDEQALIDALTAGTIKGAALDVFENEPTVHDDLFKLENVVVTPHITSATEEARTKMAEVAAINIIECLEGRTPPNVVQ